MFICHNKYFHHLLVRNVGFVDISLWLLSKLCNHVFELKITQQSCQNYNYNLHVYILERMFIQLIFLFVNEKEHLLLKNVYHMWVSGMFIFEVIIFKTHGIT